MLELVAPSPNPLADAGFARSLSTKDLGGAMVPDLYFWTRFIDDITQKESYSVMVVSQEEEMRRNEAKNRC